MTDQERDSSSTARPVVLAVDDVPDNLGTLSEMLGGLDVSVRVASNGATAIRYAGLEPRPDLILLDVMMPGMDGIQTLAEIRRLPGLHALPICFLTAKVHPAELQRWHDLGINAVLTKPFSPAKLVEQIKACWESVSRAEA